MFRACLDSQRWSTGSNIAARSPDRGRHLRSLCSAYMAPRSESSEHPQVKAPWAPPALKHEIANLRFYCHCTVAFIETDSKSNGGRISLALVPRVVICGRMVSCLTTGDLDCTDQAEELGMLRARALDRSARTQLHSIECFSLRRKTKRNK
jgi:hypothetical protein